LDHARARRADAAFGYHATTRVNEATQLLQALLRSIGAAPAKFLLSKSPALADLPKFLIH
jgi:hypothetical protein